MVKRKSKRLVITHQIKILLGARPHAMAMYDGIIQPTKYSLHLSAHGILNVAKKADYARELLSTGGELSSKIPKLYESHW